MKQDNLIWTAGGAVAGALVLLLIGIVIDLIPVILAIIGLIAGGVVGLSLAPSTTGGEADAKFG